MKIYDIHSAKVDKNDIALTLIEVEKETLLGTSRCIEQTVYRSFQETELNVRVVKSRRLKWRPSASEVRKEKWQSNVT